MAFNAKRNDPRKFEEGAWIEIMGGQFKVARAGNVKYLEALERHGKRKAQSKAEEQRALMLSIAEGILRDWANVEDEKGEAIPYSVDNAAEVLQDNPELVAALLAEANDSENYRREDVAAQAGKQQKRSDTN